MFLQSFEYTSFENKSFNDFSLCIQNMYLIYRIIPYFEIMERFKDYFNYNNNN